MNRVLSALLFQKIHFSSSDLEPDSTSRHKILCCRDTSVQRVKDKPNPILCRLFALVLGQKVKLNFRAGTADELVIKESFENDIYLKTFPEYKPEPDHTIIDIGAHIGCFSMFMAGKLSKGKVYAFEPSKETFELLQRNVVDNGLKNVQAYPQAVSDKNGSILLYHDLKEGNWGHSITKELSNETEAVETIALPEFFEKENLQKIDLIKFNCEGAEFPIIMTAPVDLLKKIRAMIVLYHEDLSSGSDYRQIVKKLSGAGFTVRHRLRDKGSNSGRLVAYQARGFNSLYLNLKALPLELRLLAKEATRKFKRVISIVSGRG